MPDSSVCSSKERRKETVQKSKRIIKKAPLPPGNADGTYLLQPGQQIERAAARPEAGPLDARHVLRQQLHLGQVGRIQARAGGFGVRCQRQQHSDQQNDLEGKRNTHTHTRIS